MMSESDYHSTEDLMALYQDAVDSEDIAELRSVQKQLKERSIATGYAHRKTDGSIWYFSPRTTSEGSGIMDAFEASEEAKQFLIGRGVSLFSAAVVARKPDGDYLVCNYVPGLQLDNTGFVITRQWIMTGAMFGDQWYELRDEQGVHS